MTPGAVESEGVWSCAVCRCLTREAWDIEAGALARYERHHVTCENSPVQVLNPPGFYMVLKTHPDWSRTIAIRLL